MSALALKKQRLLATALSPGAAKRYSTAEARAVADIRPASIRPRPELLGRFILITDDVFSRILKPNVTYTTVFLEDYAAKPAQAGTDNLCFTTKSTLGAMRNCARRVPNNVSSKLTAGQAAGVQVLTHEGDARVWVLVSSIPDNTPLPPRPAAVAKSTTVSGKAALLRQLPKAAQTRYAALEKRLVRAAPVGPGGVPAQTLAQLMVLTRDTISLVPENNTSVRTAFLEDFVRKGSTDEFCFSGTYSSTARRNGGFVPCAAGGSDDNIADGVALDRRRSANAKDRYFVWGGDDKSVVWLVVSSLGARQPLPPRPILKKAARLLVPLPATTGVRALLQPATSLYEAARRREVDVDACLLGLPDLKLSQIPDSAQRVSGTLVSFGTLLGQDVVVKIGFKERIPEKHNAILVEQRFYSEVVPVLLRTYTPNLVSYVGKFACSQFREKLRRLSDKKKGAKMLKAVQSARKPDKQVVTKFDFDRATFLVTAKAPGYSLGTWLGHESVRGLVSYRGWTRDKQREFILQVLLQIAYTLLVFEELGISHNDLHADNVLVEKLDSPVTLKYGISSTEIVEVRVRYFCRIFDFDHSAQQKTRWNPSSEIVNSVSKRRACRESGECNTYLRNRDWFSLLHFSWRWSAPRSAAAKYREPIIANLVPSRLLRAEIVVEKKNNEGRLAWTGHACYCVDANCSECEPALKDLAGIVSPLAFIMLHFSKNIRRVPSVLEAAEVDENVFLLPRLVEGSK